MSIFYQEKPSNPSKKYKCLALAFKDAFSTCHSFRGYLIDSSLDSEEPTSNFEEEEEIFVSTIISKYMESKSKRKSSFAIDSFNWALPPTAGEFITIPKTISTRYGANNVGENKDEFWSANSRLSRCSSGTSFDEFVSAKTYLSRCSSLNMIDDYYGDRKLILSELIGCEGWPFGLCRKALLLPPLPKSPIDSWSWRKFGKIKRINL